jgi:hypothetical protein
MSKYERIVHLPSIKVSPNTAAKIDALLDGLAEERVAAIAQEQMRQMSQLPPGAVEIVAPGAPTRGELARQLFDNPEFRATLRRVHGAKYTFVSKHGSVEFLGENYASEDIPNDVDLVLAEARGVGERYIAVHVKARTPPLEINNPTVNRILIQSSPADRAWVNDHYSRLSTLVGCEKNAARDVVYRYMPLFTWAAFFSLIAVEYRVTTYFTAFSWRTPLDGLQLLCVFCALALNLVIAFQVFYRILQYAFPYFEFEGNLSRSRIGLRALVVLGLSALYGSAVVSVLRR